MEPKFTKGEWRKGETLFTGLVLTSGNHRDEDEAKANTIMALAAPDMYADGIALQTARAIHRDNPTQENAEAVRVASDKFDTALSRARGETK